jgi:putative intracellular protease/amidase
MTQLLSGKKVLILVSNGVDEAAMSVVQRDLLKAGASIKTVGTEPGLVNSWNNNAWGLYFPVDIQINTALGSDFDLLVVPSGTRSVQKLAANPHSERILTSFIASKKPACLMGEAVQLLTNLDYSQSPVMTGDATGDVPAFVQKMIAHFAGVEPLPLAA